ncbi:hypothetical protein ABZX92_40635 [Lentzea sp. NPDC006480]|uniref:hypothetical protein n=1 Tax=Lentzea sp. NPDC006480 TaxID=3157176 RepID=UPI0033ACB5AD
MPTVEFQYADPAARPGAVVGAVEVVDDRLVTVTSTVVRSEQDAAVELPPGRYFARGWLPAGPQLQAAFEVASAEQTVPLHRCGEPPADRPGAGGWLRLWRHRGRSWSGTVPPELLTADVLVLSTSHGGSLGVQIVDADRRSTITMAPTGVPLRLGGAAGISLLPGVEATLLTYLDRGDLPSARIVASDAMSQAPGPGEPDSSLLDTAVGYYLLRTGNPRADWWISELSWAQPDSVDTTILNAYRLMQIEGMGHESICEELVRAASNGLPVVAEGLRLLISGLVRAGDHQDAPAHVERLRHYAVALAQGPLTAFPGLEPAAPRTGQAIWSGELPVDVLEFDLGAAPEVEPEVEVREEPSAAEPALRAARRLVAAALAQLQSSGLRPGRQRRDVTVDGEELVFEVTPSANAVHFDLELRASPLPAIMGIVVSLQVTAGVHVLESFDETYRCRFTDVPAGAWVFTVRQPLTQPRLDLSAVSLPVLLREPAFAASDVHHSTEILRMVAPGRNTLLVLTFEPPDQYRLEVTQAAGVTVNLVAVEYTERGGATVLRLLPLPPGTGRASGSIDLQDMDIRAPWQVVESLPPEYLTTCSDDEVEASIGATASRAARMAWRSLAGLLSPELQALIEEIR